MRFLLALEDIAKQQPLNKSQQTYLLVATYEPYIACCEAIKDTDLTNTTHLINKPTLVIVGSDDKSTPPILVEATSKLIKNCSFKVINNSGHLPCIDNPIEFSYLLKNFLK